MKAKYYKRRNQKGKARLKGMDDFLRFVKEATEDEALIAPTEEEGGVTAVIEAQTEMSSEMGEDQFATISSTSKEIPARCLKSVVVKDTRLLPPEDEPSNAGKKNKVVRRALIIYDAENEADEENGVEKESEVNEGEEVV